MLQCARCHASGLDTALLAVCGAGMGPCWLALGRVAASGTHTGAGRLSPFRVTCPVPCLKSLHTLGIFRKFTKRSAVNKLCVDFKISLHHSKLLVPVLDSVQAPESAGFTSGRVCETHPGRVCVHLHVFWCKVSVHSKQEGTLRPHPPSPRFASVTSAHCPCLTVF